MTTPVVRYYPGWFTNLFTVASGYYVTRTHKWRLVQPSYIFSEAHVLTSDLGANEVVGGNYVAPSFTATGAWNTTTKQYKITAPNPSWTNLTATYRYLILTFSYTSPDSLLYCVDLGEAFTVGGANITFDISTFGAFSVQAS